MRPVDIVIPTLTRKTGISIGNLAIACSGHPDVRLIVIEDSERKGFTNTVNRGMRKARSKSDICLLNDDVLKYQFSWLVILQNKLHSSKMFGIAGPSGPSGTKPLCTGRIGDTGCKSVHHIPFWCVLIKRSTFKLLGLLDKRYIHYASDNQYCDDVRRKGLLNIWVKDVYLWHRKHGSGLRKKWADHDHAIYRRR